LFSLLLLVLLLVVVVVLVVVVWAFGHRDTICRMEKG
jgi:hypothetical protein